MTTPEKALEQLLKYKGTNPRPADFDEYWDKALKEVEVIDPQVELKPRTSLANFADCFDLYFTGVGNARIHAHYLRPKKAEANHQALLLFHGYGSDCGDWIDKYPYVAQGASLFAMEVRGQGGLSEDPGGIKGNTHRGHMIRGLSDVPEKMFYRAIFLDCVQMAKVAMSMPEVDSSRIAAFGNSQGGGLALACSALEPRIKKAAVLFPGLCDFRTAYNMGFGGELATYFQMYDPLHEKEEEIFTQLGYIDVQFLAPRIKAEVFMATALKDQSVHPNTQFAAYNRITSPKSVKVYPDFGHSILPRLRDERFEFLCGL